MTQKDHDQIKAVMRYIVEQGDIWRQLPDHLQEAAMAQFLRCENNPLIDAS